MLTSPVVLVDGDLAVVLVRDLGQGAGFAVVGVPAGGLAVCQGVGTCVATGCPAQPPRRWPNSPPSRSTLYRAIEFKKFLIRIDQAVPAGLDVHLVCDNYATHNTAEIRTWLGKHPRFHVHFTPTGSSWMNQVERWFGLLTDKLIRRGVHTSVKALEDYITAWIDTWNENPRPFTWTKTADEILNSLADYLTKVGTTDQKTEQN
jgi:transposase